MTFRLSKARSGRLSRGDRASEVRSAAPAAAALRPGLTRRGWGVVAAAGALLGLARLLASVELAGLGAAAGAAVAVALFVVGRAPPTYRGERWLAPSRVGVGAVAEARLRFTNTGSRPTTAMAVATDLIDPALRPPGLTPGGCLVPPLGPGAMAEARYDLPTGRRGAVTVGPLVLSVADPFGLAERRLPMAGPARLAVHPRIHPILALPASSTREARLGTAQPVRAPRGDDFFALREYEVGDDLRRVHWRSTARAGDLMLRQDERRVGEVATVLLDTRGAAHRGDNFERALEVAASVAAALFEDGRRLRFLTTGGFDAELDGARARAPGSHADGRWAAVLEHLAVVTPDAGGPDRLALAIQSIRHRPTGPLAAIVGDTPPAELAALAALAPRLGLVVVARCEPPPGPRAVGGGRRADGGPGAPGPPDAVPGRHMGFVLVPVGPIENFPEAWNEAVRSCGRRDPVRR
ncbi:MAG: hypothetical protein QOD57_1876 [Actinomycetota bacterium]|nr:hypothetical protein [Actinomycetota bacterium]